MKIKQDYLETSVDTILRINPTLNREEVRNIVKKKLSQSLKDPSIVIDNNVTRESTSMTLSDLCNWIAREKPVVSGNATFYKQPDVLVSPASDMLRNLKKLRKAIKKEMFNTKDDPDRYAQLDLSQSNTKVIMNAEYGASGAPTSAFYTKYSPAATTMMAQSIITTMAAFFEAFVGDNMKFAHINECFDWLRTVSDQKVDLQHQDWVQVPSKEEVKHRIQCHFSMLNPSEMNLVNQYIDNLNPIELTYVFYANNFKEFIRRHPRVIKLIRKMLEKLPVHEASDSIPKEFSNQYNTVQDYNDFIATEMFLNPYSVPDVIKNEMKELSKLVKQYCFVCYLTPDSIVNLNAHMRNTVLLVDTDSNVVNANIFVEFVLDELFPKEDFGRDRLYNDMICSSILASLLDTCMVSILEAYGIAHHADEEARQQLVMKNEFFFRRFFLMTTKKRYASSIALREGHIVVPFKTEIKGLDFIKAGVTDDVTTRFTQMLEDCVLFSSDLKLHQMMVELRKFEQEILTDLKNGGLTYLKGQTFKSEGAYKQPWAVQAFKAVAVWNAMFPKDRIYSLDKVRLAKLIITNPTDLEVIQDKYPQEYASAIQNVFHGLELYFEYLEAKKNEKKELGSSPTVEMRKTYYRKYPEIMRAGMSVIAIPATSREIPIWLRPLLDYQTIVSDTCASFRSVLESFRIDEIPVKTAHGKANRSSGLISV